MPTSTRHMGTGNKPTVAYVVDPGFPGGTSSAVAAEMAVVQAFAKVEFHALKTKMFPDRRVSPQLSAALKRLKIPIKWDSPFVSADLILFHNPSCLKFQEQLGHKLFARHLIVVTHENFVRPGDAPAFDVAKCLAQIEADSITLKRSLAPVSIWNRETITSWMSQHPLWSGWHLLDDTWFNICEADFKAPTTTPKDRRGRHSRPGSEKFPSRDVLSQCFPKTAEKNIILGADVLMRDADRPGHWSLFPFGSLSVDQYFDALDFLVYFTAPTWRESFGRVIAEAIAAGKIAITDPDTASTFQGAAIGARPEDVDGIIKDYIDQPNRYADDVRAAQDKLRQYSPEAFGQQFQRIVQHAAGNAQ